MPNCTQCGNPSGKTKSGKSRSKCEKCAVRWMTNYKDKANLVIRNTKGVK